MLNNQENEDKNEFGKEKMVAEEGFEPPTHGL
jgi:hypothetical protein